MQKNWRDLIKPKKLEVDKDTLTLTYGKFVAEPLERGFGVTIGNALRRILLSSLQGAAITSVKIDGVLHEFSSVPGVKEDVSDIILNLKQVPVSRVNFNVTHARVGQRTDYDKLVLEVWTTGAIDPQSAVAVAAKILKDQLSVFITFEEGDEEAGGERGEAKPQFNDNLFKTVDELELSVRSANCLKNADIKYIGEMVQKSEQEMLRTKNFGRKSLNEIKEILKGMGLDFGMKLDGFPSRKDLDATHSEQKETA
uniref:DNA-directed RNA polymerase subunit alpha n=1 Tax=uncultured delta proteobacterium Rifle_16ft_4_minimus_12842 TaxID=1665174 RepID=A0A0H4T0H2_9DELT|nr:DNA-directed RNA polymerase subunit alpha, DNA-directed RNA polymerase subunit alpha [uncultured delta proteobacterium Rifle_16ft_4_minimus_12842]